MNPKERVQRRINGQPVDKVPNLNIIMQFASKYIGIPYGKYCTDYRYLVEGNIKCCREFGIDMVSVISDPYRETEGFGANVVINPDDVPSCKDYLVKEYSDLGRIKVSDPVKSRRMEDRIKAVEFFKEAVGEEFPILGWVEGPIAEACDLRGLSQIFFDLADNPDFVRELMEITLEQAVWFAREQVKAGADYIGVGDAAASLIGPELYKEFVLPMERRLFNEIHKDGGKVKLHICGNITSILDSVALSGADMIDVDWMVSLEQAVGMFKGKASACGNFDPVKVLLQGSIDDIAESVRSCLAACGGDTFIAAGCEVPKLTPCQNLKAVDVVLQNLGCL